MIPNHDDIEYTGPDWNPNDPLLKSTDAPHETAGILRIHRSGVRGQALMNLFPRYAGTALMRQIQRGLDQEGDAYKRRLPIHDATVQEGTK
ncbi:hypothetical protein [Nocardia abscessus]|uniref:hypothetical protein n=1 Tax=Nocardia abscessus TaxID=120957 RepID=UPI002454E296|nr:hypothetical protein [Nocardia abscessus]